MPFKYFPPTYREGEEIMQLGVVRDALHAEAERRYTLAKELAESAGLTAFANALRIDDDTRPKGRPYSAVIADDEQAIAVEFGDNDTERRRILGRVGNTQLNTR